MSSVLVAGVGNVFLGDDGFGPAVVARLAGERLPPGVHLVDYGIRGVHLSYDLLDGWDALVLVDALPGQGEPGELRVLEVTGDDVPAGAPPVDTHALHPLAVLAAVRRLGGGVPATRVVGCIPASVEEGLGLSAPVAAAVGPAAELVGVLCGELAGASAAAGG